MSNPIALITGSARRIGAHTAKYLHNNGVDVIIHCHHSRQQGQALVDELNQTRLQSAWLVEQDLSEPQAAEAILAHVKSLGLTITYLINNASVFIKNDESINGLDSWEAQFHINTKMPYALSLAFQPMLKANQGAIINITDIHSLTPLKDYTIYCQSKAALAMQTRALAKQFAPDIRVNAVAPGAIAWPEEANALSKAQQQSIIDKTYLKKHGHPDFIAQAVYALISNPFITGQHLCVDGGR
ncbi:SDR family oxidoreductase [Legionella sp. W05-934-2]|uniref:SDR family oxidoreductase n=1 Tax=Legionella sp. W05-934-2 TaxID=1198649 RepID=UPI0034621C57